jgi:hypothetical protein
METPKTIRGMIMGTYEYTYLAQAYDSGTYGNCSYNAATVCSAATSAIIVTFACAILFIAILVRWWHRPREAAIVTTDEADNRRTGKDA